MKIAVIKETGADEARVAATPDAVKFYVAGGHSVNVTKGSGKKAHFSDADYKSAGASISATNDACVKAADFVMSINGGSRALIAKMKKGAGIFGLLNPTDQPDYAKACAKAGITAYAIRGYIR